MSGAQNYKGFTIVELLITIVVIGILAALISVTYQGITEKAKDTKTSDSIAKVAKAFYLKAVADGGYKQDTYYITCMGYELTDYQDRTGALNPIISEIIAECVDANPLSNYLRSSDFEDYYSGVPLAYDNDLDTFPVGSCNSVDYAKGVNVLFGGLLGVDRMTKLDQRFDNGDGLNCGRVQRSAGGQEVFRLATFSNDGV